MTDTLIATVIILFVFWGWERWIGFVEWIDSGEPLKWNHVVFTIPALPVALLVAVMIIALTPLILLWKLLDRPVRGTGA